MWCRRSSRYRTARVRGGALCCVADSGARSSDVDSAASCPRAGVVAEVVGTIRLAVPESEGGSVHICRLERVEGVVWRDAGWMFCLGRVADVLGWAI